MTRRMRIGIVVPGLAVIGVVAVGVFSSGSAAKPPAPVLGNPCGAFPLFTGGLGLASAPDQTAWSQDISQSPVAPNSDAVIGGLPGELHPDFGSPRQYGIPYTVVGAKAKKVKVKFIAYPERVRQGPVPDPAERADRGWQERRRRSPRHRLRQVPLPPL